MELKFLIFYLFCILPYVQLLQVPVGIIYRNFSFFKCTMPLLSRRHTYACKICANSLLLFLDTLLPEIEENVNCFLWIMCWWRMHIIWTDGVWNEEVLHRVKELRNILRTIKWRKANWIGHIMRGNCLLKHGIGGKIERRTDVTGRWGRRRKQLLDDFKETRGYWKLKGEALDRTLWGTRFGRGCGPVVRQTAEWINEWMSEWMNEWMNENIHWYGHLCFPGVK
jgi:hypothetical protein